MRINQHMQLSFMTKGRHATVGSGNPLSTRWGSHPSKGSPQGNPSSHCHARNQHCNSCNFPLSHLICVIRVREARHRWFRKLPPSVTSHWRPDKNKRIVFKNSRARIILLLCSTVRCSGFVIFRNFWRCGIWSCAISFFLNQ